MENNDDLVTPFHLLDISKIAVQSANIGTWFLDEQCRTFIASDRMKELFGYHTDEQMSFEDAIGRVTEKFREKMIDTMKEAMEKKEHFYIECPVLGYHDQSQRWLRVMGGADHSKSGTHFSGIVMDITEQKQNELRRTNFIGMVSHELKTPLTALRAYIQLMNKWAKEKKDSFTIGALSKVEKQIKKMTIMVNGFLNLSGVESGKIHLNKKEFFLDELIHEVVDESKEINADSNLIIVACNLIKVVADREKIEQVILNLISNAIKYAEIAMPVELSCQEEGAVVRVSVKDYGMGIDQKHVDKLFKSHFRIKNTKTENIAGFGIGLYLSAEIIKHHGGDIGVISEVGKGSTFWFTLPLESK